MATPRNVCHRCRTKWKVPKRGPGPGECPKCGSTQVGPTDPAPGSMGKLLVLLVGGLVAAGYLGFLPFTGDDVHEAVESTLEEVKEQVEERTGSEAAPPKETPERKPRPKRAAPAPAPAPAQSTSKDPVPVPKLIVRGKSGAPLGNTYLVKGKLENAGGAAAKGVKVVVTFKGPAGAVLTEVEARCPQTIDAGASVPYEAAVRGEQAGQVEGFSVQASFDGS